MAAVLALFGATASTAQAMNIDLTPAFEGGYGELGLWLGPSDWSGKDSEYFNWEWKNVSGKLHDNGDMTITGTMERLYDRNKWGAGAKTWGLTIELKKIVLVGDVFSGHSGGYQNTVTQLLASGQHKAGLEWKKANMTLTAPYSTSVPLTGWKGLAMPNLGHKRVAELHYNADVGGLTFDAWYQNKKTSSRWYRVGDTKAHGIIPEPNAATVFAVGLLVVAGRMRARRAA